VNLTRDGTSTNYYDTTTFTTTTTITTATTTTTAASKNETFELLFDDPELYEGPVGKYSDPLNTRQVCCQIFQSYKNTGPVFE
jgi:hypothetical protein